MSRQHHGIETGSFPRGRYVESSCLQQEHHHRRGEGQFRHSHDLGACPDGRPFRVRHYRDLLRTGVLNGERPFDLGLIRAGVSHHAALRLLALAKSDPAVGVDMIASILDWASSGMEGFPVGFARGKVDAGVPNAVLGATLAARRAGNVGMPADRVRLGEGGWGHERGPVAELLMLACSDRSADAFYESAADRGVRRRLVARIVAKEPMQLAVVVDGHPDAKRLLAMVMQRPDEPGLVLRYRDFARRHDQRAEAVIEDGRETLEYRQIPSNNN